MADSHPTQKESIPLTTARTLTLALLLFTLTGCASRLPGTAPARTVKLDPNAPAAAGHLPLPLPEAPSPLTERPPQGLYATEPSADTLARLSTGTLSPDGQFRLAVTAQGAWVARIDGAWLWEIQLPAPPPKEPEPPAPGGPLPPPPPPPPPPTVVGAPHWTPQSTLLLLDSNGLWQEANPAKAMVTPLPAALQGTTGIAFSPDGRQVLYYKGAQLFTALRDGTQPKLIGANLIGSWTPEGKLVTTSALSPTQNQGPNVVSPGLGKE
ncbi:MAG: hypothetical protein ACOY94_04000 [Bacillota bacterium]